MCLPRATQGGWGEEAEGSGQGACRDAMNHGRRDVGDAINHQFDWICNPGVLEYKDL